MRFKAMNKHEIIRFAREFTIYIAFISGDDLFCDNVTRKGIFYGQKWIKYCSTNSSTDNYGGGVDVCNQHRRN